MQSNHLMQIKDYLKDFKIILSFTNYLNPIFFFITSIILETFKPFYIKV